MSEEGIYETEKKYFQEMTAESLMNYMLLCAVVVLLIFLVAKEEKFYSIKKNEWKCVQSRILDNQKMDQVECIVYKKIDR